MKFAFHIAHPSQFYIFRNIISGLSEKHHVIVTYNAKDVVEDLINSSSLKDKAFKIENDTDYSSSYSQLKKFINKEIGLYKRLKKFRPDLIIGTSIIIAHIAKLLNSKSIIINEDDFDVISGTARIGYPFASHIVSPYVTRTGKWDSKVIKYNGYQKLAYLHPEIFKPDEKVLKNTINGNRKFSIIRFAKLKAHHDKGIKGLDIDVVRSLISNLEEQGDVYISSEIDMPEDLKSYELKIPVQHIHTIIYHAQLLISDSQSMSVEAAMLGIPSIRFNDLVGRISVLEELEKQYQLTFGIKTAEPQKLIDTASEIVNYENIQSLFKKRHDKMIQDKINVLNFFIWLIDNFPDSIKMVKNKPEYVNKNF